MPLGTQGLNSAWKFGSRDFPLKKLALVLQRRVGPGIGLGEGSPVAQ